MKGNSRRLSEGILGFLCMSGSILALYFFARYMLSELDAAWAIRILKIGELPFHMAWLVTVVVGLLLMFPFYWGMQWVYYYYGRRLDIDSFGERVLAACMGLPLLVVGLYATYLLMIYVTSDSFRLDSSQGFRVGVVPIPFELIGYIFLWGLMQLPLVWGVRLFFF